MDTKSGVQQVVSDLYTKAGEVSPSALVDAARPEDSPAHSGFEWDDSVAGEEYRLIQARQWIRKVEIIIEDRPERLVHVPTILHDGGSREGYYKPAVYMAESEYARAKAELVQRLKAAKKSVEDLEGAARGQKERRTATRVGKLIDQAVEMTA